MLCCIYKQVGIGRACDGSAALSRCIPNAIILCAILRGKTNVQVTTAIHTLVGQHLAEQILPGPESTQPRPNSSSAGQNTSPWPSKQKEKVTTCKLTGAFDGCFLNTKKAVKLTMGLKNEHSTKHKVILKQSCEPLQIAVLDP